MNKIEAPAYSIGEFNGKISVRVDSGKFMDTQYVYDSFDVAIVDGVETLQYKSLLQVVIVNGILRDKMELEHKFPELISELNDTAATPILFELMEMAKGTSPSPASSAPKIIVT